MGLGLAPTTGPWGPGSPEAAEVQEQAFGRAGHFSSSLWKRKKKTSIKNIKRRSKKAEPEQEKVSDMEELMDLIIIGERLKRSGPCSSADIWILK